LADAYHRGLRSRAWVITLYGCVINLTIEEYRIQLKKFRME